jgi:hypothetical protein
VIHENTVFLIFSFFMIKGGWKDRYSVKFVIFFYEVKVISFDFDVLMF